MSLYRYSRVYLVSVFALILLWVPAPGAAQNGSFVRVSAEEAQVLRGPSITTVVLGVVPRGTAFPLVREEGDWYLVDLPRGFSDDTHQGYLHRINAVHSGAIAEEEVPADEPRVSYSLAGGPGTAEIGGLESVWESGVVISAGTEVRLGQMGLGRFLSFAGDVSLGLFGNTESYPNADNLQAISGLFGVKLGLPTAVRPYLLAQGGYTTFYSGRASLENALTGAVGGGLDLHLSAYRLSAFIDGRVVRTLGGDGYTPITAGVRYAP